MDTDYLLKKYPRKSVQSVFKKIIIIDKYGNIIHIYISENTTITEICHG
ncbi:hypothetical protein Calab_3292 [Caldithrix abyssi DSM 13497]|uniref:Uncharacterized protein n=1 Tax=Caldithrix abyssi DSM 13497 TaxID=880073 RepID=H1XVJ6_CALAY|nr:hypothetical protein Cabys_2188 [Caldithrix abyssi DSM 13497]EHO42896.1 hypothetical protein Calab_3292 [Caldithrix abyssi DSM 13497]